MKDTLNELYRLLLERKSADPKSSYVAGLYVGAPDSIAKKIGEEATELVISGCGGSDEEIIHETADLWFHTMVLLAHKDIDPQSVLSELDRRFGQSGLEEKASRQQQ